MKGTRDEVVIVTIVTQICGIALIMVVLILSFIQKRIELKAQNLFRITLIMVLISLIFDAASVVLIRNCQGESHLWLRIVCKAYLISLVIVVFMSFEYFLTDIDFSTKYVKVINILSTVYAVLCIVSIMLHPIRIYYDKKSVYTYGGAVNSTYIAAAVYILLNIIGLTALKKQFDRNRWEAGVFWMIIWSAAAITQYMDNKVLLVGYGSALGIAVLFIKLENPGTFIDKNTGLFNEIALEMYIDNYRKKYGTFAMCSLCVVDYGDKSVQYSGEELRLLHRKIAKYLEHSENKTIFKHYVAQYSFLFKNEIEMQGYFKKIERRFQNGFDVNGKRIYVNVLAIKIPDMSVVTDTRKLQDYIRYINLQNNRTALEITIDKKFISQMNKKDDMVECIEDAIRNDRIDVFYQPIFSTDENRYISAEALCRIRNKDGGIIPPIEFIDIAEKSGHIVQIGEIVFEKACRLISESKLKEKGIKYLEVNLSAVQCAREDLADNFISIMKKYEIKPSMINLEITESAAISSKENLLKNMRRLIEYGVSFSLDDFGTGHSNLNYIMELPVEIVKFDRVMTNLYFENEKGKLIMKAAIDMIKAANMRIVSEGVETIEQLKELTRIEIDYIQGYYFSKPVPSDEFIGLLQ